MESPFTAYNARKRASSTHPALNAQCMEAPAMERMTSLHPKHMAIQEEEALDQDKQQMQALMQQLMGILVQFQNQNTPSSPPSSHEPHMEFNPPRKVSYDRNKSVAPDHSDPKMLVEDEEGRALMKSRLCSGLNTDSELESGEEDDYIAVLPVSPSSSQRSSTSKLLSSRRQSKRGGGVSRHSKLVSMSLHKEASDLEMQILSKAEVSKNLQAAKDTRAAKRSSQPGQHHRPTANVDRRKRMSSFSQKHAHRLSRRRSILPNTINVIQYRKRQYHLDPFSFGRLSWEWVVFAVSVSHVVMAPLYFAWKRLFIYQWSYTAVVVFVADWFVQALTSYMKKDGKNFGLWERDPATLIKFYLREYFFVDFLISFPLAAIIIHQVDDDSSWNIMSLLDFIKIIRVQRAFHRFKKGTLTNPSLWKLIILWCILLYIWHLYACIYWKIEMDLGLDETTMGPPIEFRDTHFVIEYTWAVFWVVSVNAGSATYPEQPIEALFACFTVITGVLVVAGVISTTNNAVREYDTLDQRRTRRLREILQYLRNRHTTPKLIREVLEYYIYCFENNIGEESGADLLNELPTILRERLIKTFYKPIIEKIPLFDDLPKVVLDDLVLTLERRIYVPGEYLIIKGEIGREMYIISYGRIRVELGQHCIYLGEGDYLGEQAMLTSAKRNASAFCESHCELLVLRRTLFIELCAYYTDLPLHILQRSPQYMNSKENVRLALKNNVCKSFGIKMKF